MKSSLVLLTRSNYESEMRCWLNWHLNCMCVDNILVIDNESTVNVKDICNSISKDRITHIKIDGNIDQYAIYNEYIKSVNADWVMAIDDDEYVYIGDKYNHNVNTFLDKFYTEYQCNKCYIPWVNLYSKLPMNNKNGLYINTHTCYSFNASNSMIRVYKNGCNKYGKCFFRKTDKLDYIYRLFAGRWVGHSPMCINGDDTLKLFSGETLKSDWVYWLNEINTDCFIAHYQFKNKEDWKVKCIRPSIASPNNFGAMRSKMFVYNELYKYSDTFKECTLLKDLYNSSQLS